MGKRQALRQRYGLQEDCNDCLATAFCTACAVCQEARELKFRSAPTGGK
jgi:Cys-rich protein (TIGR01571 family)